MANQVAKTIAAQIGNTAFNMIGARNLVASERALTFKVGRNPKSVSHVRVTLEPSDTYKVEFLRVRGTSVHTLSEHEDIYCDGLRGLISSETGLAVSL